jgi:Carboxypeptidase regulatory-like domain
VAAVVAVTAAVACAPKTPGDPGIPAAVCQPRCARAHDCDPTVDVPACVDQCVNATGPRAIYWRPEMVAAARACAERQTCVPHVERAITACKDDAYRRLEPSPLATAYCEKRIERQVSCTGRSTYDLAHCLHHHKGFADPVLSQLTDCLHDSPCRWLGRCYNTVVGYDPILEDPDRERAREYRPIPSLRDSVSIGGTVTDETDSPVTGATVCVLQPATQAQEPCTTTDALGVYALTAPAHAEVSITVRAEGFAARLVPMTLVGKDVRERSVPLHSVARTATRYGALGATPPGETIGGLFATAAGLEGTSVPGATFLLDPMTGKGPLYFSAAGAPDAARTSASRHSSALFANLQPGEVVLTISASPLTCVPAWGGWPSRVPGSIRVPILAGFETVATMLCQ